MKSCLARAVVAEALRLHIAEALGWDARVPEMNQEVVVDPR